MKNKSIFNIYSNLGLTFHGPFGLGYPFKLHVTHQSIIIFMNIFDRLR
jgi:hypothetical protein